MPLFYLGAPWWAPQKSKKQKSERVNIASSQGQARAWDTQVTGRAALSQIEHHCHTCACTTVHSHTVRVHTCNHSTHKADSLVSTGISGRTKILYQKHSNRGWRDRKWIKCMPCKCKNQSSDAHNPRTVRGNGGHVQSQNTTGKQGGSKSIPGHQVANHPSFCSSERETPSQTRHTHGQKRTSFFHGRPCAQQCLFWSERQEKWAGKHVRYMMLIALTGKTSNSGWSGILHF